MPDKEKILSEGKKLLDEFSKSLEDVPETDETHYVVDLKNVLKQDGKGSSDPSFPKNFEAIAPKWDFGYLKVEKKR